MKEDNLKTDLNLSQVSLPKNQQEEEFTIDFLELLRAWRKYWWVILLCMLFLGGALGIYCKFLVSDAYRADASLYITANTSDDLSNVSYSTLQTSAALTGDYENIIKSRYVLMQVADNLGLTVDYDDLYSMVEVTNPEGTHIIQISVTCEVPDDAIVIANEVMEVSSDEIYKIIGGNEPTVVSEAMSAESVKPSTLRYIVMGALVGLALSGGLIAVRIIMDTTIKTEEDVTNVLELPVLATVPRNDDRKAVYGYGRQKSTGGAKG